MISDYVTNIFCLSDELYCSDLFFIIKLGEE